MTALAACGGGDDNGGGIGNTAPTAAITTPLDGDIYTYGDTIIFTGSGTDAEEGDVSEASLVWTSDLDGEVGTGVYLTLNDLSWGDHAITLTATDSNAATGSDTIHVSVKAWRHPTDTTDNISPDGQDAYYPQVTMDGSGNAIIIWDQFDGTYGQIFMSENRDEAWNHPAGLSDNISPDGQNAYAPQVAMGDNGNAVIAWPQYDDNGIFQIFMSEYN